MALPTQETIRQGLLSRGLSPHVAEGFLMNFQDESGLNPGINEIAPTVPGSRGGFGLYQLTGPRRVEYEAYAKARGVDPSDVDAQLDFMMQELETTERGTAEALQGTTTAGDAASVIVNRFLRPAEEHRASRTARYTGQQVAQGDTGTQTDAVQDWTPVHNAFLSGKMSEGQQSVYRDAIASGEITAMDAPASILEAYSSGAMTPEQTAQFDAAVDAGIWAVPRQVDQWTAVHDAFKSGQMTPDQEEAYKFNLASGGIPPDPEAGSTLSYTLDEPVTIDERRSPGGEVLRQLGLTVRAGAEGTAGLLGLASDPIASLINLALEDESKLQTLHGSVSQLLTSAGVPEPETTAERIVQATAQAIAAGGGSVAAARGLAGVATNPATRATAAELAKLPLGQLTGGGAAGLAGQATQEAGGGTAAQLAAALAGGVLGSGPIPRGPVGSTVADAPAQVPPAAAETAANANVGTIVRQAAAGNKAAQARLAELAAVDPEALAAAQRLGIELPADVLSNTPIIQSAAGLPRSIAGSEAEAAWTATINSAMAKADEAMTALGSGDSIAAVSDDVLTSLNRTRTQITDEAAALYSSVDELIPPSTPLAPNNIVSVLNDVAEELGGVAGMTTAERRLLDLVSSGQPMTYARLIREKNLIGKALARGDSPYSSLDNATLNRLYGAMAADQLDNVAAIAGPQAADDLRRANALYATQKGMEDRIISAFGRDEQGSIATSLNSAMRSASTGDAARLNRILEVIPEDLQREAVATALMASTRATRGGVGEFGFAQFSKMYSGLRENAPVYNRVVGALGPEAHEMMNDLFQVSQRITSSRARVLTTGKANQALVQGMTAEGLVSSILNSSMGRRAVSGASATGGAIVAGPAGAGIGAGLASMLASGKKDVMQATGRLFSSPEFSELATTAAVRGVSDEAVSALAQSPAFRNWAAAAGIQRPEAWIQSTLQALRQNETQQEEQ